MEFFYRIRLQNPKEEDQVIKREVLTEFQAKYAACVSEISCQFQALQQLFVAAMQEEFDVKKTEDMLAALKDMLAPLWRLHEDPSLIMEQEHQLHGNRLDTELNSVSLWRKGSAISFTSAAAFSSGAGVAVAKINGIMPAAAGGVAAAASILFIAAGKWMDSYLKKLKAPLKKRKYVINAMTVSGNIVINDLKTIKALVDDLQSKTASIMETVKEGVLEAAVIRKNMEALKETFQKLEVEVNRCNWDVNAVSGAALNCVIKNWI